jgi:hypothetical protein
MWRCANEELFGIDSNVLFFVSYLGLDIIVFVDCFRQGKVELDNKARDDNYNDMDRMKEK